MASRRKRDIPFGPQFSPSQTPLPNLLDLLAEHRGNYDALVNAIQARFFPSSGADRAKNTPLALRDYGIVGPDQVTPTPFGEHLIEVRADSTRLYGDFAKHILLNLNGLAVVQAILDEIAAQRADDLSLETLPRILRRRGLRVPRGATHISALKGWLHRAGVFTGGKMSYAVDEGRLRELIGGLSTDSIDALADLNELQRDFLKALARFPSDGWHDSRQVARAAELSYGRQFPEKSLKGRVVDPLVEAGFIEAQQTTAKGKAKPWLVRPSDRFVAEVVTPLLDSYRDKIGSRLREYFRTPMDQIVAALKSPDKNVKGKALELLAVGLIFTLDLAFIEWRKRGKVTGGAEVDVLAESARLIFSRWQIQCKNGRAALEDVAKEVGLAYHLNSNVVLVLTTRRFTRGTREFAGSIMRKSNLQIILLDARDLDAITVSPANLFTALSKHSEQAMRIKQLPDETLKAVEARESRAEVPTVGIEEDGDAAEA